MKIDMYEKPVTENRAFTFSNSKKWYFQNSEY